MVATKHNKVKALRVLFEYNADMEKRNADHDTALMIGAKSNSASAVKELINNGGRKGPSRCTSLARWNKGKFQRCTSQVAGRLAWTNALELENRFANPLPGFQK